jgi:predicted dehydrogenase
MIETGSGRRSLLRAGVVGAAWASTALSYRRVWGANERIRLGVIGTGARAQSLIKRLKEIPGAEQIQICDVYEPRLLEAAALLDGKAKQQRDHRAVLDSRDVDAVVIGAPQHWHKQMTLDALAAGKDIFLEKAVSHTIDEGVQMVKAVEASKQVVQTGTQQRSWAHYIQGAELVRAGKLGQLTSVHAYWYMNSAARTYPALQADKLDWKRFTGSAKMHPVSHERYWKWRWYWDYGGGPICELLTHWIDVVHWYTGTTAPSQVYTRGSRYVSKFDVPDTSTSLLDYPTFQVTFTNNMGSKVGDGGIDFHGTAGTLKVTRQRLLHYPDQAPFVAGSYLPAPEVDVRSQKDGTASHLENFLDCVRSRKTPTAPMRVAHEAARVSHLCNLSFRQGAPVRWNNDRGKIERA